MNLDQLRRELAAMHDRHTKILTAAQAISRDDAAALRAVAESHAQGATSGAIDGQPEERALRLLLAAAAYACLADGALSERPAELTPSRLALFSALCGRLGGLGGAAVAPVLKRHITMPEPRGGRAVLEPSNADGWAAFAIATALSSAWDALPAEVPDLSGSGMPATYAVQMCRALVDAVLAAAAVRQGGAIAAIQQRLDAAAAAAQLFADPMWSWFLSHFGRWLLADAQAQDSGAA